MADGSGAAGSVSRRRWRQCFSELNLDSFLVYVANYASADEIVELKTYPVVYHRFRYDELAVRIPVGVTVDGVWHALPEVACDAPDCLRCTTGRGGFQFCWIDGRWTPEAALDLTQTRFEAAMAAQNAFPEGCLKRPRPENQVAQAFALDVAF